MLWRGVIGNKGVSLPSVTYCATLWRLTPRRRVTSAVLKDFTCEEFGKRTTIILVT